MISNINSINILIILTNILSHSMPNEQVIAGHIVFVLFRVQHNQYHKGNALNDVLWKLSLWFAFQFMMTSSNGNIFRVTGLLCGEFTGPVISPHKDQWRVALMFSLIWTSTNGWVNNREAGDLRRHRAHSDVIVMFINRFITFNPMRLKGPVLPKPKETILRLWE